MKKRKIRKLHLSKETVSGGQTGGSSTAPNCSMPVLCYPTSNELICGSAGCTIMIPCKV